MLHLVLRLAQFFPRRQGHARNIQLEIQEAVDGHLRALTFVNHLHAQPVVFFFQMLDVGGWRQNNTSAKIRPRLSQRHRLALLVHAPVMEPHIPRHLQGRGIQRRQPEFRALVHDAVLDPLPLQQHRIVQEIFRRAVYFRGPGAELHLVGEAVEHVVVGRFAVEPEPLRFVEEVLEGEEILGAGTGVVVSLGIP